MATRILFKRSNVPGVVPRPEDLAEGELGINTADGRLFIRTSDGTVKEIGGFSSISTASPSSASPSFRLLPGHTAQALSTTPTNPEESPAMSDSQLTGRGWSFPPVFSNPALGPAMVEGDEDIRQALRILIDTRLGERAMRPEFGSPLADFMFSELDADSVSLLSERLADVIVRYEPRIDLESVDVDDSEGPDGILNVQIHYTIRETNTRDNLVYPFYLLENTTG